MVSAGPRRIPCPMLIRLTKFVGGSAHGGSFGPARPRRKETSWNLLPCPSSVGTIFVCSCAIRREVCARARGFLAMADVFAPAPAYREAGGHFFRLCCACLST